MRFGGDEFMLLAPFTHNCEQLDRLAETLILQYASVFEIIQNQVVISASLGGRMRPPRWYRP